MSKQSSYDLITPPDDLIKMFKDDLKYQIQIKNDLGKLRLFKENKVVQCEKLGMALDEILGDSEPVRKISQFSREMMSYFSESSSKQKTELAKQNRKDGNETKRCEDGLLNVEFNLVNTESQLKKMKTKDANLKKAMSKQSGATSSSKPTADAELLNARAAYEDQLSIVTDTLKTKYENERLQDMKYIIMNLVASDILYAKNMLELNSGLMRDLASIDPKAAVDESYRSYFDEQEV